MSNQGKPKHSVVAIYRIWKGKGRKESSIEIIIDGQSTFIDLAFCGEGWKDKDYLSKAAFEIVFRDLISGIKDQFDRWEKEFSAWRMPGDLREFARFVQESGIETCIKIIPVPNFRDLLDTKTRKQESQ